MKPSSALNFNLLASLSLALLVAAPAAAQEEAVATQNSTADPLWDSVSDLFYDNGIYNLDAIDLRLHECQVVQSLNKYIERVEQDTPPSFIQKLFTSLFPFGPALNALLATTYISGPPNFLLALIPPQIDPSSLNTLVSFAIGGLLGDVFLHLLPQTFVGEVHESGARFIMVDEYRNTLLGLAMFVGFLSFIILEKAMRILGAGHDHDSVKITHNTHVEISEKSDDEATTTGSNAGQGTLKKRKVHAEISDSYTVDTPKEPAPKAAVKLSAYLNLIADFTHNITDGLAISASFYISKSVGATTCLAVFFHEIPHEVGDFALLIQGGFTKRQAMGAQFVTAVGAYVGTLIGIAVNQYARATVDVLASQPGGAAAGLFGTNVALADLTLPFTAGGFLYIGTVGVIPEVIEADEDLPRGVQVRRSLVNLAALLVGIALMFFISLAE